VIDDVIKTFPQESRRSLSTCESCGFKACFSAKSSGTPKAQPLADSPFVIAPTAQPTAEPSVKEKPSRKILSTFRFTAHLFVDPQVEVHEAPAFRCSGPFLPPFRRNGALWEQFQRVPGTSVADDSFPGPQGSAVPELHSNGLAVLH
jgi:hypothetical protein